MREQVCRYVCDFPGCVGERPGVWDLPGPAKSPAGTSWHEAAKAALAVGWWLTGFEPPRTYEGREGGRPLDHLCAAHASEGHPLP